MAYTPEQIKVAKKIKRIGRKRGEERVKIKANLETGIVESALRNLNYGDADSKGYRQERASIYGSGPNGPTDLKAAINRFYDEADQLYKGQNAGQLAADVQRPAAQYRGRYGEVGPEAKALLKGSGLGGGVPSSGGGSPRRKVVKTTTRQVPDTAARYATRQTAALGYLNDDSPDALIGLASNLSSANQTKPQRTKTVKVTGGITRNQDGTARLHAAPAGKTPHALKQRTGTLGFEGHQVAAWIKPVLKYAREHGWKGQIKSGYRTYGEQAAIYNSGVRPAAKPGTSNHEGDEFPRGAIDVSEAEQLSAILLKSPYSKLLQFAGAKDPVHFSHPHGGSY